jgi:hypothetical protein
MAMAAITTHKTASAIGNSIFRTPMTSLLFPSNQHYAQEVAPFQRWFRQKHLVRKRANRATGAKLPGCQ